MSLESLWTDDALVLSYVGVDLQVCVVRVIRAQGHSADGTDVLGVVVRLLVTLESVRILEAHLTFVAREWTFVRVYSKVGA